MKIPLVWLKDYVELSKSPKDIADSFTRIGLMLDKPVGEDGVLDLEQRLNRSDLLSIVGCARDYAVFERLKLHEPKIKLYKAKPTTVESKVNIVVKSKAVRRFSTRVFRGIKVGPSPVWLRERLELYGIESKNNIVDITNFVMTEYGQTMHAQDIDRLPAKEIIIRPAKKGEQLTTLLGTQVTLEPPAFVLASGGVAQVIGGIVGGKNSGVTDATTNIVLDAGNYDPHLIRKVSRQLKIFNESVSHNDKYLHPKLCEVVLDRATDLILRLAGGTYYENDDYYPLTMEPQTLTLTSARLRLISGQDITLKEAKNILVRLGYAVVDESKETITVETPYYRTDLEVEDDLISDVLRMRDYNTIPSNSLNTSIPVDITPNIYRFEDKLRDYMIALGGHEHITTQLVINDGDHERVVLENALSEDQNALRMSALETLPTVSSNYLKHGIPNHILFEIGKSFIKSGYAELRELAIIDTADIRATLATLFQSLGITVYELKPLTNSKAKIVIQRTIVGQLMADRCVLDITKLENLANPYPTIISDFIHSSSIDLSLSYPSSLNFSEIVSIIRSTKPTPSTIQLVEEYQTWKLVRISWQTKVEDIDNLRKNLTTELIAKGIQTRSG